MDTLGRHLIADFYGCDAGSLDDEAHVRRAVVAAAGAVGSTVVSLASHRYAPQGVTAVALIAESHLSVHTWPEHGYAAIDIFTCGGLDPGPGFSLLAARLGATEYRVQQIVRGADADLARHPAAGGDGVRLLAALAPRLSAPRGTLGGE